MPEKEIIPEHMTVWDRNARLYETLKGMGLYVLAIPQDDNPSRIDQIIVSAGLPKVELSTAKNGAHFLDVGAPVGIVRLNGLNLQNLQLRTSRLQVDTTRPAQRLGFV